MLRKVALAGALLALAACSPAKKTAEADFDVSVPLKEVMGHVMDPAAWAFWDRSGEYVEASGTRSRVPVDPKTLTDRAAIEAAEAEWTIAENGTQQLIQVSNILKLPGYVRVVEKNDNGDWLKFAERLNVAAHAAQDAVEAKDGQKMFDTGGQIYEVCTACHSKYLLPFVDPKTGEIPEGVTPQGEPVKKTKA